MDGSIKHSSLGAVFVSFQFWSAYAPCSSQHLDAVQLTLEQIDLIRRLVNLYPQHMALVTTADGKYFAAAHSFCKQ